jgi:amino acid transporter
MAQEGHLPGAFGRTNGHRAPWVSVVTIACVAVGFIWYKPLSDVNFYYNTVVVTLALAYMAALAAFTRLIFRHQPAWRATLVAVLPMLAFAVLGYLMYSAGAAPADPRDLYQAWYIGAGVLVSALIIVFFGKRTRAADVGVVSP